MERPGRHVALSLTPENGLLSRITQVANLPWIMANGLHAANGVVSDLDFVRKARVFTRRQVGTAVAHLSSQA